MIFHAEMPASKKYDYLWEKKFVRHNEQVYMYNISNYYFPLKTPIKWLLKTGVDTEDHDLSN